MVLQSLNNKIVITSTEIFEIPQQCNLWKLEGLSISYTIHSLISCNFLTNRYSLKFSSFYEFCQLFLFSIEVSWTNIDQFVTPGDYWFSKTFVTFALWHDMTWQHGFLIKIIRINNNRNALYMIVFECCMCHLNYAALL